MFFLILFLSIGFFGFESIVSANSDIVINEIQIAGIANSDEFIELYNTSSQPIDLAGFKLTKKSSTGSESNLVVPSSFTGIIPALGYFLISHQLYKNVIFADLAYSGSSFYISANNTIILYDNHATIVDKVGFGTAKDYENISTVNPGNNKSIERTSFQDTDNNNADFSLQDKPTPKNSLFEDNAEDLLVEDSVCKGDDLDVKINEIYPNTENEDNEFVEIINNGEHCVDISGWAIKDSTTTSSHKTIFAENIILESSEYFYIRKKLYLNNDNDTVYLLDETDLEIDKRIYEEAIRDRSYSFDGLNWQWTSKDTPGAENEFDEAEKELEPKIYPSGIKLNELLPNPSGKDEEYVEILNDSEEDVDLTGWILRDATKTKKYTFTKDDVLNDRGFLVIKKSKSGLSLNDSGAESVRLFDPNGKLISEIAYNGAKDGLSYGFDGSKWRWSKYLTPGAKNLFADSPSFKIEKDKKIYKNFPANFDVVMKKYKKNKTKITWDFGDGHKSYKKTTTHKYEKNGKYKASVKIFNGSEEVIKTFKVEVKSFPKYDVEIIGVNPNPDGKDSDFETVTLKNNAKKKINLQKWSIATGDKKLINHPITQEIYIQPKEVLTVTRDFSKFVLNNKKAQVELRYPNGKVASKIAYDKKTESIAEGEIFEKTTLGWVWKSTLPEDVPQETSLLAVASEIEQNLENSLVLGESDSSVLVGSSMLEGGSSKMKNPKDFKIILANLAYAPFLD